MPDFPPFSHYALTVSDLERSIAFYERLVGAPPLVVGDESTYRFAVWLEPKLALHQHQQAPDVPGFSERRLGLDHVAFGCSDREELEGWKARLDELHIAHGEIVEAPYGAGLAFRDPDGIQLEFFVEGTA